jgi:choline dehydrogenase-like flavoprotein
VKPISFSAYAPGLRVADASIMPSVPRANTNLPSVTIGEKWRRWC